MYIVVKINFYIIEICKNDLVLDIVFCELVFSIVDKWVVVDWLISGKFYIEVGL